MTEPIRAAVIGFGNGGRTFHTAFISAVPGLELAAIVQRKGDEAAQAYPKAKIYRSVEEMLADESIQLVSVTTSNQTHFEIGRQCLLAGKHTVIDKPFALTSAEAAELIAIARERKLVLSAFQNRRWDGDFSTMRDILSRGVLGRLVVFESHYDRFRQEIAPRHVERKRTTTAAGSSTISAPISSTRPCTSSERPRPSPPTFAPTAITRSTTTPLTSASATSAKQKRT